MADKQIDELPDAGPLDGTESVHVVQAAQSRKATTGDIAGIQHDHAIDDVAGLQAALDAKADADDVPDAADAAAIWSGAAGQFVDPAAMFAAMEPQDLAIVAGDVEFDMSSGLNFNLTLTEDADMQNPTNVKFQSGRILFIQDETGGHALTWDSNWKLIGDAPTLSTAAGAKEVFAYFVNAAADIELSYVGPKA